MFRLLRYCVFGFFSLAAGCGTEVSQSASVRTTPQIRAACRQFGLSDAEMVAMLSAFEADRQAGFTFAESSQSVIVNCRDGCRGTVDCSIECITCGQLIVDLVY